MIAKVRLGHFCALALLLAITAIATSPARAQRVTMNVGFSTPVESDYGVMATKLVELAKQYSNGEIDVRIRCCAQIATEDDAFKAMQLGTVDAYFISQNNISPHFPLMDIFVLPYIFQSGQHVRRVRDGAIGQEIAERLEKATKVHLLAWGSVSYRDFYNSKRPINAPADMAGLKVRVPKNEVMIATFRAFGAEPVPLAWSETPTALQTRTVDGSDNGTSVIKSMKFYEFSNHLTILEHFAGFAPLLASNRFMSRLSEPQRKAILRAAREAGEHQARVVEAETEEIRKFLAERGMATTRPDTKPFVALARKVQDEFGARQSPEFRDMVERIRAAAQ